MARNRQRRDIGQKTKAFVAIGLAALTVAVVGVGLTYDAARSDATATANSETQQLAPLSLAPPNSLPLPISAGASTLFYGDSITAGSFADTDEAMYRNIVASAVGTVPTVVAQSGIRTGSFLAEHPVAPQGIGLAIVGLGTNDVGNTEIEEFRGSYSRLLTSIRDAAPDAALVCIGPWRPSGVSAPYLAVIRDECFARGGRIVPIDQQYGQASNRGPADRLVRGEATDNFHPNDKGHAEIARQVLARLDITRPVP